MENKQESVKAIEEEQITEIETPEENSINEVKERVLLNKMHYIYVLFTVLALLGTITQFFTVLNVILCIFVFVKFENKVVVPFVIYATFFASILKVPFITDMSMITLVILLYSFINIWKKHVDGKYLLVFVAFLIYSVVVELFSDAFDIARNVKFFNTFLYTYFAISNMDYKEDGKSVFGYKYLLVSFIAGVIVSSLMRFLDGELFNISQYVYETTSDLGIGSDVYTRFSGLYKDPNYYSVNVILAMCVTVFLYAKKDIKLSTTVLLTLILGVLIILTRGKSGFLMLLLPLILFMYINKKRKDKVMQVVLFLCILIGVALVITGRITIFNSVLDRFKRDTSINEATTGRIDLWLSYLGYFISEPLKLIFGSGISANVLGHAAHNTYLDMLYYLGIIASVAYVYLIVILFKLNKPEFKRNILNFGGIIAVGVMYFFLSSLFDIDIITNLIVIITLYNTKVEL